jgi:hypothetical protein
MKVPIALAKNATVSGTILSLGLLVLGSGCASESGSHVVDGPPDFVRTNWQARRAELKCLHLVAPRVEIVRMDYFSNKDLLTNEALHVQNILPGLVQNSVSNRFFTPEVSRLCLASKDSRLDSVLAAETRVGQWLCSDSGRNHWRYNATNCPPAGIRKDATNLAAAFCDDALLLIEYRGKTNTRSRSVREVPLLTIGITGGAAGVCVEMGAASPQAPAALGQLGLRTGWFAGWVVTGFGDFDNEFDYKLGTYSYLRAILLDGRTGEVLWSKTCLGDFDRNELDTLVKAVFHQPNL